MVQMIATAILGGTPDVPYIEAPGKTSERVEFQFDAE